MAGLRAETALTSVTGFPGRQVSLVIDVVNNGELIDGVTTRVIGLPSATVTPVPALLPLFPEAAGQVTLLIDLPTSQAAGVHPISVEVSSAVSGTPTQHVDLSVDVEAHPAIRLTREPALVRARRNGRFVLAVENSGNVPLEATLSATTSEGVSAHFSPATLTIEPGTAHAVLLRVTGPRMVTGSEVDRPVEVTVTARPASALPDSVEETAELADSVPLTLKQRPMIGRGVLTFVILAAIVGIWAAIFLLGLTQVFKGDPLTKVAPVSFYASPGDDAQSGSDGAPAGSTPKTGLLAAGVGGEISGTVRAASNNSGLGRITVSAWRMGRDGPVEVSSAATQSDGSYTLAGLFPTRYWLRFTSEGYRPVWYPEKPPTTRAGGVAATATTAGPGTGTGTGTRSTRTTLALASSHGLAVGAQSASAGTDVVMSGKPAVISGRVSPGDASSVPVTTVTATLIDGLDEVAPTTTVSTDGAGVYELSNLPAPGTYQLSFAAEGYAVTTQVETVSGGEQRREPTILLGSRDGTITGTVTAGTGGSSPLGGVTVTTTVAGTPVTVITPTVGAIGSFQFDNLPTPGTYLVTFTAPGHGSTVRIVDLDAGGSASASTRMTTGTGSVSGMLLDADGKGLGGASVTVGGVKASAEAPATTTLTSGTVGAFSLTGLASPGTYTLTFSMPGADPVTIPVTLVGDAPLSNVTATLTVNKVKLFGLASTPAGAALVGATVTVSDGVHTWTTTSTNSGGSLPSAIRSTGGYLFPSISQGIYNVTVSAPGYSQRTARVQLDSAGSHRLDLTVAGGGS